MRRDWSTYEDYQNSYDFYHSPLRGKEKLAVFRENIERIVQNMFEDKEKSQMKPVESSPQYEDSTSSISVNPSQIDIILDENQDDNDEATKERLVSTCIQDPALTELVMTLSQYKGKYYEQKLKDNQALYPLEQEEEEEEIAKKYITCDEVKQLQVENCQLEEQEKVLSQRYGQKEMALRELKEVMGRMQDEREEILREIECEKQANLLIKMESEKNKRK
ncbi:unnamed protein product [Moneuplotes crassus]|uniref:Uncharacterized protein n=1 Tax=Euplotes crassus TaxID=5936 RepID=A0AAD1UAV4_EUPCR|nr:unnamed protein product [Moneuplotes crassus]